MKTTPIQLPTWDSIQYNTFSRSNVANYQATSSVSPNSASEVLRDSILFMEITDSSVEQSPTANKEIRLD